MDKQQLIVQGIRNGETYEAIGSALGISRQRVQQIAKKHGVRPLKVEDKPLSDAEWLVADALRTEPRLSYDELAERHRMETAQVKRIAERVGVDWMRKPVYHRGIQPWDYDESPDTNCWQWRYGKDKFGHGRLNVGKAGVELAHRFAYRQHNGDIPKGESVFHTCGSLGCVNPEHLRAAPKGEAIVKGRRNNGNKGDKGDKGAATAKGRRSNGKRGL